MGARDSEKSRAAIQHLKEETGKDAFLVPLDLSDLHQVRKAAEEFLRYELLRLTTSNSLRFYSKENRLDVLLNNALVSPRYINVYLP